MKKYMEIRVEGRRPVGKPKKTWLENIEMAELEIDREDIYDRKIGVPTISAYTWWNHQVTNDACKSRSPLSRQSDVRISRFSQRMN